MLNVLFRCLLFVAILTGSLLRSADHSTAQLASTSAVEAVLNRYHESAAKADGTAYFALFAPECILMGTDATERWTVEQFKDFARPYFSKGQGWTYRVKERHVSFTPSGDVAWFDEILSHDSYGVCRGTGVLRKAGAVWLICQYQLTIPVPNELAGKVVQLIRHPTGPAPLPAK
jgi:ketosteroid isomerase-like protein